MLREIFANADSDKLAQMDCLKYARAPLDMQIVLLLPMPDDELEKKNRNV